MFGKLKDKLKSWVNKVSKEKPEELEQEETKQEKPEKKSFFKSLKKVKAKPEQEEINEEKIEEIVEETKRESFLKRLTSSKRIITEEKFSEYAEELEMILLENNVALEVAEKIISDLKKYIVGEEISKKEIQETITESLKETIEHVLIEPFDLVEKIKEYKKDYKRPYVILFCGINGTGKTTTIAKLINLFKKNNLSSIIAAGDTFRAASIEQLKKHGEKLNVKVISHEYGSDPASVGFETIKIAEKNLIDVVLIDTAGRMHTAKNLLREMEKVKKVCKPALTIFVGESITGNDSTEQVKAFNETIGIDAIILSKADIDEKGGTALSVGYTTKKPILFLGTGQEYDKLEKFNKKKFVEKLGL
ncbi:MAG: signal recognition particle-docking protein FtsY [Candidatus Pacearchaeota archaeon]|jgi:fused signal recognition particle receptor